jgi:hypothetical protein
LDIWLHLDKTALKKGRTMKKTILIAILVYTMHFPVVAHAAGDSRFFGTYCGIHKEKSGLRTLTFEIRAVAGYRETDHGNGLVTGHGNITGEGRNIPFVFSGVVTARGRLSGSAITGNLEPTSSTAVLSEDGNAITLRAKDHTIVLKKDQCGNEAPTATIRIPEAGRFPWGDIVTFAANVTDREDTPFSGARVIWSSDRDGKLGNGLSITNNGLSPGRHRITLSATDSGGRTATDMVTIDIENTRPNPPVIEEFSAGPYYDGRDITARARANDSEDGNLTGDALVWSSDRDGRLGTGNLLIKRLSSGDHSISVQATDRAGSSSAITFRRITVRPRPAGNTPPVVTITSPANHYAMGDNECFTLVAQASDLEDGRLRGRSLVWTDRYNDGHSERTRDLGTGESITLRNPPAPVADTRHEISVMATDSGGLSSTPSSIVIYVIPGGLI